MSKSAGIVQDPRIEAVLTRVYEQWNQQRRRLIWQLLPVLPRVLLKRQFDWSERTFRITSGAAMPVDREQGALLYLTALSCQARRIVEYGTSHGVSTLYLAAAVRDNGGGVVIGTEILEEKARVAQGNFDDAGVAAFIDLRVGDARETLKDCGGIVDLVLLDGWKDIELDVLKTIEPQLKRGAMILTDNIGLFPAEVKPYHEYMDDPANGYRYTTLPLKDGMDLAIYLGPQKMTSGQDPAMGMIALRPCA